VGQQRHAEDRQAGRGQPRGQREASAGTRTVEVTHELARSAGVIERPSIASSIALLAAS